MAPTRVVLVTGAASGIGRAFAEALAGTETDLILLDVDTRGLATTVDTLRRRGATVASACADVGNRANLEPAVSDVIAPRGRLDLLVHCAAILGPGAFASQAPDEFDRVQHVNLIGTANVIRAALPWLRRARGQIVTLASTAALHGWPGLAAYSAAKFAVAGYCDAIRPELAREGVGVTVVFPLLIDTPLLDRPDLPPVLRRGRRLPAATVVRKSLRGAARRRSRVYVPATVRVIAALHGLAPSLLDWFGTRIGLPR